MKTKKHILLIIVCFVFSVLIVSVSRFLSNNTQANFFSKISSIIPQDISYSDEPNEYYKIYSQGQLVALTEDIDHIYHLMNQDQMQYVEAEKDYEFGFNQDIVIVKEIQNISFNNINDQIFDYLKANNLIGVKATEITISQNGEVKDIIYVSNVDDYIKARDSFILNFTSASNLEFFKTHNTTQENSELGTIDYALNILENVTYSDTYCDLEMVYTNEDEIYKYIQYGRNTDIDTYITQVNDTSFDGIAYFLEHIDGDQLYLLNKDKVSDKNVLLTAGKELVTTYFTSPLTVQVIKHNLTQQEIAPASPIYKYTDEKVEGGKKIVVEEEKGLRNVLFEEIWENGILISGYELSSITIKEPVTAEYLVQKQATITSVDGLKGFIPPVANPKVTCKMYCYTGHMGTDFKNKYELYCDIYAVESGVVTAVNYQGDMGYYVIVNHGGGIVTRYLHMKELSTVEVGQVVLRGDKIGIMGNTGRSFGVHLHLDIYVNGTRIDACSVYDCDSW